MMATTEFLKLFDRACNYLNIIRLIGEIIIDPPDTDTPEVKELKNKIADIIIKEL